MCVCVFVCACLERELRALMVAVCGRQEEESTEPLPMMGGGVPVGGP